MGVLGSILGGAAAAKAAKTEREAQEENFKRAMADRELSLDLYNQARGSQGSALLPLYFGTGDYSFEKQLAQDYRDIYDTAYATPGDQITPLRNIANGYMPMIESARKSVGSVFDGSLTRGRLENAAPVMEARTRAANVNSQGIYSALMERINALKAMDAAKGYTGGGSFSQNRLLAATVAGRQQAAGVKSQADLANAMDRRVIMDMGLDMPISYASMPFQQAGSEMGFTQMPANMMTQGFAQKLAPLNFYRIGNQGPNLAPTPQKKAIASSNQIWLQAGSQAANDVADAALSMYGGGMMGGGGGGGGAKQANWWDTGGTSSGQQQFMNAKY